MTVGSTLLLVGLVASFCLTLFALGMIDWPVAQKVAGRFLTPATCLCFAVALIPIHTTQCFAMYIRSQKFDPIWRVNLPACSSLALLAYLAARSGHIEWIAASMAIVFSISTIALAMMWRWYHRHFQAVES